MLLKVLSVAYPFATVGPHLAGGAEQILTDLDQALVDQGHSSLVVACNGSQSAGELFIVELPQSGWLDEAQKAIFRSRVQHTIDRALASRSADLVHMHGLDFHEYWIPPEIPVLVTLHLPIAWYPEDAWHWLQRPVQFCCVSHSQKRTCPPQLADALVIENGVSVPARAPQASKENYAVVLSRICPEKNIHEALEAASMAGTSVLLAGKVFPYPEHQAYFQQCVQPLLEKDHHGVRHTFFGPVDPAQRFQLLARAKCLLHPTRAPETSSLVAMEALAAGTPVIAYRSGALTEIIQDGLTGYLVDTAAQMAESIGRLDTISTNTCYQTAKDRFDKARMLEAYVKTYHSLLHATSGEIVHA